MEGTPVSEQTMREGISSGLVAAGLPADQAEIITDLVIDVADVATNSAVTTIDINMPDLGKNYLPARHLALQVLVTRLNAIIVAIEADLVADGARRHSVEMGVGEHG